MSTLPPDLKRVRPSSGILFLLGVFCIFSTIGFANDATKMGRQPLIGLAVSVLTASIFATLYAISGFVLRKNCWKAIVPLFALHIVVAIVTARAFPDLPWRAEMNAAETSRAQNRLDIDRVAIIIAVFLGYTCFVYVSITEARRHFRVQAEMELAREVHQVIVPPIEAKLGEYAFYGRSVPSGEVGGDLIDVAGTEDNWLAYVADVSGHGVAPGVVMGMVKSATRTLLSSRENGEHLLPRLNEILYPLKKPDMFVTFCLIAKEGDKLRVGLAGHPSILRFSAKTNSVTALECPNLPLGILPSGEFATAEIPKEAGQVLALYTDGLLEAANAAGEEFGLKRLQAELEAHGRRPLDEIYRSLQEGVARHGAQFDDQSVLLIRQA